MSLIKGGKAVSDEPWPEWPVFSGLESGILIQESPFTAPEGGVLNVLCIDKTQRLTLPFNQLSQGAI